MKNRYIIITTKKNENKHESKIIKFQKNLPLLELSILGRKKYLFRLLDLLLINDLVGIIRILLYNSYLPNSIEDNKA